ncbi:MAG: hypothetical protein DRQ43_09755 [Gammaproteobacteria bacterium]|nr:MAG: hypothetical protein DRQ43_09755 [Gammaproteobacteria bacterium]
MPKIKHEIDLTDEQLEQLTFAELQALAEKSVGLASLQSRIRRGWTRREAACEPINRNRKVPKNHPLKQFSNRFYSQKNKESASEREKNWRK